MICLSYLALHHNQVGQLRKEWQLLTLVLLVANVVNTKQGSKLLGARSPGLPQILLRLPASLKFLQGAKRCTCFYTQHLWVAFAIGPP